MKVYAFLFFLFLTVGCSNNRATSAKMNNKASMASKQSNEQNDADSFFSDKDYIKDVVGAGLASVAFGSLLLHDTGGSFKTANEGWFEEKTSFGGMDKLGHAWYGASLADFFYERNKKSENNHHDAVLASGLSFGIMTLIEVADGFAANKTGFSNQDLIADAVGASISYLRNTNPKLKELVDFRLEYLPDYSLDNWETDTFYSDQKYLLALKLSGIDALKSSPLRYFEIHSGYYARGYSSEEQSMGVEKERNMYVGIGLSLSELFNIKKYNRKGSGNIYKSLLEHVQLPYTYVESAKKL